MTRLPWDIAQLRAFIGHCPVGQEAQSFSTAAGQFMPTLYQSQRNRLASRGTGQLSVSH